MTPKTHQSPYKHVAKPKPARSKALLRVSFDDPLRVLLRQVGVNRFQIPSRINDGSLQPQIGTGRVVTDQGGEAYIPKLTHPKELTTKTTQSNPGNRDCKSVRV